MPSQVRAVREDLHRERAGSIGPSSVMTSAAVISMIHVTLSSSSLTVRSGGRRARLRVVAVDEHGPASRRRVRPRCRASGRRPSRSRRDRCPSAPRPRRACPARLAAGAAVGVVVRADDDLVDSGSSAVDAVVDARRPRPRSCVPARDVGLVRDDDQQPARRPRAGGTHPRRRAAA